MRPGYTSPNYPKLASIFLFTSPVYVCNTLSEIKVGICLGVDIFDLDQGRVGSLVAFSSLEAKKAAFAVKSKLI